MSDIASSLIGLTGGLLAALLVALYQAKNTKTLIAAELEKVAKQHSLEWQTTVRARKEQWLLDAAPNLLTACDPQVHAILNYAQVVSLIHRVQIILNPNNPLEDAINTAASNIGFAVQNSIAERRSMSKLLSVQDKFIVAVRAYLHAP